MERDRILRFTPVDHPDARVRRVGFDLDDPYVEQCWSAVVGPSSTLLLRRLPVLWAAQRPAEMPASHLASSLGLGTGTGLHSRLTHTLNRLVQFRLAAPSADGPGFDVPLQVPPLASHQLNRVPGWTRDVHERLVGAHLTSLTHTPQHRANVASITARLDRIQNNAGRPSNGASRHGQGIGR